MEDFGYPEPLEAGLRPSLGDALYEEIKMEQHKVHLLYADILQSMLVHSSVFDGTDALQSLSGRIPLPPPPTQPVKLCCILGMYACALFDMEARRYPSGPELIVWLTSLALRIEHTVAQRIAEIERLPLSKLSYHATLDAMRSAIRDALKNKLQACTDAILEGSFQKALSSPDSSDQETKGRSTGVTEEVGTKRKALFGAYQNAFPEAFILDICWAAKQHYREWTRWIGGQLKNGSKPDRAFRSVLTSGKRPEEYRPEHRTKNWK